MRIPQKFTVRISAVVVAAAAVGAATIPAAQAAPAAGPATWKAYQNSAQDAKNDRAFFEAVLAAVKKKQRANPGLEQVTVTYSNHAPTFSGAIATSTQIWNSSVSNVRLQETSGGADLDYREGNDPIGSYADTDMHGHGYIFLDYRQNQIFDSTRVAAHETGHALGLYDHYEGPCSELMSGGGPGPSCTNPYPDGNERGSVERMWANGLLKLSSDLMK